MVRAPGRVQPGQVSQRCVDHYDTFSTICDWAGIELDQNRNYAGASYAPPARRQRPHRLGRYPLRRVRRPAHDTHARATSSSNAIPTAPTTSSNWTQIPANNSTAPAGTNSPHCRTGWSSVWKSGIAAMRILPAPALRIKFQRTHNRNEAWRDGHPRADAGSRCMRNGSKLEVMSGEDRSLDCLLLTFRSVVRPRWPD